MSLNLFPCQNLIIYKKFRKIRCQNIPHNTCIFLVSYRTKIPGTMSTLDLMWFSPSVISNIESRIYSYLPAHFMFTSPIFIQVFFIFILDFYTKSYSDYLMSFYKSHFVLLRKASISKIYIVQKHMSLMSPDKKALQLILCLHLGCNLQGGPEKRMGGGALKYF